MADEEAEATPTPAGTKPAPLEHVDIEDEEEEKKQYSLQFIICAVLVIGSVVCWAISIALYGGGVVTVAGIVAFLIAPYVSYQRYELRNMDTLREVQNKLRDEVNRLSTENNELEGHTDRLQEKAERVSRAEANLNEIATSQGSNATALLGIVKENGEIQDEMKDLVKQQVVEQMMTIVIQSDRDQDFHLNDQEIDMVLLRVRSLKGVEKLDEDKMRALLQEQRGMGGLMQLIREMASNSEKMKMITVSTASLQVED
eukprot:CAMPEP_0194200292 /NCGR_PEP_ID=MMETSP0156-20130528/959_1 /TAXON_ID=33649 /ORGANISM="Thalassionema nitzschioides, Strain L26-B" /LENGTH=256 /DNA_ID=CAMNT_0038925267 /DNA_START=11 /DNA_END=781 /DNA_ORIENTATION=+